MIVGVMKQDNNFQTTDDDTAAAAQNRDNCESDIQVRIVLEEVVVVPNEGALVLEEAAVVVPLCNNDYRMDQRQKMVNNSESCDDENREEALVQDGTAEFVATLRPHF